MKKLIISSLMIIILIITIIPKLVLAEEKIITPDYSWYESSSKTHYEINSEEQLIALANIVNGTAENIDKDTFEDKTISIKKNLDLTDITWTPIGSSMYDHLPTEDTTKMFEGTIDGEYHTIKGLSSNNYKARPEDISSGEHSYGLIGYAYGASLKNLNLLDVEISCSGEAGADGSGIAAAIGYYVIKNNEKSVIENVNLLSGNVKASNNMGGLIGYMEAKDETLNVDITIKNCLNKANVITDAREAGGILGLLQGINSDKGSIKFINCINEGNITANAGGGNSAAAGILGKEQSYSSISNEAKVIFNNCKNTGKIKSIGRSGGEVHAAGITTVYYSRGLPIELKHCINTGEIEIAGSGADNYIAGLIAHIAVGESNPTNAIIQNSSYNLGTITYPNVNNIFVIYDINGATGNEEAVRTTKNKNITLAKGVNITRDGYEFIGWNTKIDGTGTNYKASEVVSFEKTTTLYAQWKKQKEKWEVLSIKPYEYTGEPIKPEVTVYDELGNVIPKDKYIVTYEEEKELIKEGKHTLKVTYNEETIELEYEVILQEKELVIVPSEQEIESNKTLEIIISEEEGENITLICDDDDVIIKKSGNKFLITLPNKEKEYMFTAIYENDENEFKKAQSYIIKGKKVDEITPPNTGDTIIKSIILAVISLVCLTGTIFIYKKKIK